MFALSSDRYVIDLPAHHTFPMQKYRLIREQLLAEGTLQYPLVKVPGSLDIGLADGAGDETYLAALEGTLAKILADFRPGLVFYLAGVDPYEHDRLGRLRLTHAGLRERDHLVLRACR